MTSSLPDNNHLRLLSISNGFKFIPADGFTQWKLKVESIVEALGFHDVLEEEVIQASAKSRASFGPNPASKAKSSSSSNHTSSTIADKEKRSHTVFTFLLMCLQPEQMRLVQHVNKGDAHALWRVLLDHFERKTMVSRLNLRQQFAAIKMAQSESFDTYLSRFKHLVTRLTDEDEVISEMTTLATLLQGLPSEYINITDTIGMNENITFEQACSFIKDKQDKLPLNQSTAITVAFQAADKQRHAQSGRSKGDDNRSSTSSNDKIKPCRTCNERGHDGFDCPLNKDKVKCTTCRWVGAHTAENCKYLPNPKGSSSGSSSNSSSSSSSSAKQNAAYAMKASSVDPHHDYDEYCFSVRDYVVPSLANNSNVQTYSCSL
jgi:hypothetical protein